MPEEITPNYLLALPACYIIAGHSYNMVSYIPCAHIGDQMRRRDTLYRRKRLYQKTSSGMSNNGQNTYE